MSLRKRKVRRRLPSPWFYAGIQAARIGYDLDVFVFQDSDEPVTYAFMVLRHSAPAHYVLGYKSVNAARCAGLKAANELRSVPGAVEIAERSIGVLDRLHQTARSNLDEVANLRSAVDRQGK